MSETQTLTIGTVAGPKKLIAPAGWKFDKGSTTTWCWLLSYTADLQQRFKRQRDRFVLEGQIHVLAIVLSNALGMAPYYWEKAAKDIVFGKELVK